MSAPVLWPSWKSGDLRTSRYFRWLVGKDEMRKEIHSNLHCFQGLLRYHITGPQSVVSGPAVLASPGNLLDMPTSGLTPDLTESKLWAWARESILTSLLEYYNHRLILHSSFEIFLSSCIALYICVKRYKGRDHLKDWSAICFFHLGIFKGSSYLHFYFTINNIELGGVSD